MKGFIPWVRPESSWPANLEEEEEKEEMTRLLDRYAARKRKRQESYDREPDQVEGSNRPITDGSSEMQAIVIPGSLETGLSDQLDSKDVASRELREVTPIPPALQVIHPPDRAKSQMDIPSLCEPGPRGCCFRIGYC